MENYKFNSTKPFEKTKTKKGEQAEGGGADVRAQQGLGQRAADRGAARPVAHHRRAHRPGQAGLRREELPEGRVVPAARAEARAGRQVVQGQWAVAGRNARVQGELSSFLLIRIFPIYTFRRRGAK